MPSQVSLNFAHPITGPQIPLANTLTAPGKKLGDYELLRFIRSEGDTEVHEALQLSIDRKVALVQA